MHLPQLLQRIVQPRFDRTQGAAQRRRDLVELRPGEESQLDDEAMVLRQIGHGLANSSGVLRCLGAVVRRQGVARCLAENLRWAEIDGLASPPPFQKPMPQDAVKPSREPAAPVETRERSPRLDQRLLRKILGPMTITTQCHRRTPQPVGVPPRKLRKSDRLARLGTVDQRAAVVVGHVHDGSDSPVAPERFTCENSPCCRLLARSRVLGGGYAPRSSL